MKTAIGLMSGTSMDGIDVAMVRTDGESKIEFGPTLAVDYPARVKKEIEACLSDAKLISKRTDRPGKTGEVERLVTKLHEAAVLRFLSENNLISEEIDVIGFHGQTILHRPEEALTVQLGLGQALADGVGIDVVYDLRAADMEAGGQGAPLVPVFHSALAHDLGFEMPLCLVNIGGISNITYIDEQVGLIAFDCGPGNALIDQWVAEHGGVPFDQGGRIASEGQVLKDVATQYLSVEYFDQPVPKSLDRADFIPLEPHVAELSDGARTLAHVTAAAIYKSCDHLPQKPKAWIICGGGRLNCEIVNDLKALASADNARVMLAEEAGLQGDMLEAQAFGYLAVRSLQGLPLTFPTTTGCRTPVTGGILAKA